MYLLEILYEIPICDVFNFFLNYMAFQSLFVPNGCTVKWERNPGTPWC